MTAMIKWKNVDSKLIYLEILWRIHQFCFTAQFPSAIPILRIKRFQWTSTALETKRTGGPSSVIRLQKLVPNRWGWS